MRANTFLASALLFTLFIVTSGSYDFDPETNNLIVGSPDFDNVLKESKFLLVNFHALWCKYSKQLRPEWIIVSRALQEQNYRIKIAQVEAYDNKDLAKKYKIEGTPTIKLFINQEPHNYTGLNKAANILEFVQRKMRDPLTVVTNYSTIETKLKEYEWIGILVGSDAAQEDIIKDIAFDNGDILFVETVSNEVKRKYGGQAKNGQFIFVNNITGTSDVFTGIISSETIPRFIKEKKFPTVPRFSKGTAEKIFYGDDPAIILIKSSVDGDKSAEIAFRTAANTIGKSVFMTIASYDEEIGRLLCRNLGIEESELPTVRIVKPGNDRILKYYFDGEITENSVHDFYRDYLNNNAKRFYLSEPVPRENSDLVRKVVGKTFDSVVNDPYTDVLLFITVPWCSHCVALNPIYDNVARKTHNVANFLVTKIDASENDLEAFGLDVLDFPTILFFPKNDKSNPIDLQGPKDEYTFDTFIRAHANVSLTDMKGPNPFDKDEL